MTRVHAVVLAAGRSARFGVNKLLLPAGPGHTIVSRAVDAALAGVDGVVVVVLGRDPGLVRRAVLDGCTSRPGAASRLRFETNARYAQGLGGSVAAGARAAGALPGEAEGIALILGDQPLVGADRVRELVAALRAAEGDVVAVAAASEGRRRNPVLIRPELLPELVELAGDEGARRVLARHRRRVRLVEFGDGDWRRDVDAWPAYAALARGAGWDREAAPILGVLDEGRTAASALAAVRGATLRALSIGIESHPRTRE